MKKFLFPVLIFLIIVINSFLWLPGYGSWTGGADVEYQILAKNMFEGKGFSLDGEKTMLREPVYPFFLFLNYKIFGLHLNLIIFEQLILYLLICFLVYKLAEKFLNGTVAKIATVAVAAHPLFIICITNIDSETMAAFLIVLFCFVFIKSIEQEKTWLSLTAGFILGILVLTKAIFTLTPIFLILLYAFAAPKTKKLSKIILFSFAFILLVFPWMYRNHSYFGKWLITERGGWVAYMHTSKSELSNQQLKNYVISYLLGQYFVRLSDASFNVFDVNLGPVNQKRVDFLKKGYSSDEADILLAQESWRLWKEKPFKNFSLGFLELYKANAPTVPKDSIAFVYAVPDSFFLKVARGVAIIFIRLFWLSVICFMFYGLYKTVRMKNYHLLPPAFFIFYLNGILFFLEGVPRNIFPIYSFYFIFFAAGLYYLMNRFKKNKPDTYAERPLVN